jgi:A/G-specific adenine glycosylase
MPMPPDIADLRAVRDRLLAWYGREHREFPWRGTRDPYAVLVSEVMLQQTQASRVVERFERFMRRFPTAEALAAAPPAEVLAEWSGLGYNRRAVALRRAARAISLDRWPRRVADLERLPGVGPYTARAIASLAFGQPVGVVDTNVRRWLVRRFGADDAPLSLQALADRLATAGQADADACAAWTHATMEFGAAVCRARAPRCDACPIAAGCPSRGTPSRVEVPRQAAYRGSRRARRGALLRALSAAPRHRLSIAAARAITGGDHFDALVARLEHEGLAHRTRRSLRLGARDDRVATIGA